MRKARKEQWLLLFRRDCLRRRFFLRKRKERQESLYKSIMLMLCFFFIGLWYSYTSSITRLWLSDRNSIEKSLYKISKISQLKFDQHFYETNFWKNMDFWKIHGPQCPIRDLKPPSGQAVEAESGLPWQAGKECFASPVQFQNVKLWCPIWLGFLV